MTQTYKTGFACEDCGFVDGDNWAAFKHAARRGHTVNEVERRDLEWWR